MKLVEIATGWTNFIGANPQHQQMIEYRLSICDTCPSKRQLSPIGKRVVEAINDKASIYYCGQCKCPLASKSAAPTASCPLNKWGKFLN